jgi:hypothetical protein
MRILKIYLKNLRNEEWFGLYAELRELVPLYGANALGITALFDLLEPLHDKADRLLERARKSTHTDRLKEAKRERNVYFRSLYGVVKKSRNLPLAADKAAAERLYVLLAGYRKAIINSSYAEESSAIFNLLQDLQNTCPADITLLGLGKWVENLGAAQQKFKDILTARNKEYADKPTEHLTKIRPRVDELYKSITQILYAQLVAEGLGGNVDINPDDLKTGPYEDNVPPEKRGNIPYNFVIAWNVVLKRYRTMLAARAGRKEKDKNPEMDDDGAPVEG